MRRTYCLGQRESIGLAVNGHDWVGASDAGGHDRR